MLRPVVQLFFCSVGLLQLYWVGPIVPSSPFRKLFLVFFFFSELLLQSYRQSVNAPCQCTGRKQTINPCQNVRERLFFYLKKGAEGSSTPLLRKQMCIRTSMIRGSTAPGHACSGFTQEIDCLKKLGGGIANREMRITNPIRYDFFYKYISDIFKCTL